MLFNISGGSDLKLSELNEAAEVIQRVVHPDCNIIFGMATDQKNDNEIKLTVIATGFPTPESMKETDEGLQDMLEQVSVGVGEGDLDVPPFLRRLSKYRSNGRVEMPVS